MVRKQRVPLDVIEVAFGRMRAAMFERGGLVSGVQTKQPVQPAFNLIACRVSDRHFKLQFPQQPPP